MRAVVSWAFFPVMILGSVLAAMGLLSLGTPPAWVVVLTLIAAVIPIAVAQRLMPYEKTWAREASVYGIDFVHMVITGLAGEAARAAVLGALVFVSLRASGHVGLQVWPAEWPLLAQFVIALVVGDLGAYWVHRLAHRSPLLWRVHAMHHTSERLYVLSSARNHPMNVLLTYTCQTGPLLALGAGPEVITLVAVFTSVHGMLQHANIDLRHGVLNHVFATADLHRWHHHTDFEIGNHNFGSNLVLFDQIFGTRYLPADAQCREVGLPDLELPTHLLHHLASPFRLNQYLVPVREMQPITEPSPESVTG